MPSLRRWSALAAAATTLLSACAAERGTIGAILGQRDSGRLFIREAPERLAASRQGLRPGDEILLIDGRDVRRLDPEHVHLMLSGTVGDPVKLTVIRGNEVIRVTLIRTPAPPSAPEPKE